MVPDAALVERLARDLDTLIAPGERLGIAVSGGPDSLALLLLTAAARPESIEVATVDHALRPGSREEAEGVGDLCESLGISHRILTADWPAKPETAIQEQARSVRYRLLGTWAKERALGAIATGHQLDDQAETLMMRLARGSGVRGLAGMRPRSVVPGSGLPLIRPLLGWRRSELMAVCIAAGLEPTADPSNEDARFERVRTRRALQEGNWLDPEALAASARNLGDANTALDWAMWKEWDRAVGNGGAELVYSPSDAPDEIRRRIVSEAVSRLATEGQGAALRGRELDHLLDALGSGGTATIRGVRCSGGQEWRFSSAPARR
jgi:tRNA(Ile)-lysidine synthase